jgi:hypothetical protein
MSPDDTTSAAEGPTGTQPTAAQSPQSDPSADPSMDPFRRVVEVASGPNESGIDELVKQAHTLPPEPDAPRED